MFGGSLDSLGFNFGGITPAAVSVSGTPYQGLSHNATPDTIATLLHDRMRSDLLNYPYKGPGDLDRDGGETREQREEYRALYQREGVVTAAIDGKVEGIAAERVTIEPFDRSDPQSRDEAEFLDWSVNQGEGWDTIATDVLRPAFVDGWSVLEVTLKEARHPKFGGVWALKHCRSLDTRFIRLQMDPFRNILGVVSLVRGLESFSPDKVLIFTHRRMFHNHFGISDMRPVYRDANLIQDAYMLWYLALKLYGEPFIVGTMKDGVVRKQFEDMLDAMKSGGWAAIQEGDKIELLSLATAVNFQAFEAKVEQLQKNIFMSVRGSALPFMQGSGGGAESRGNTRVQEGKSDNKETLIGRQLCRLYSKQLAPILLRPNFGPDVVHRLPRTNIGGTDWKAKKEIMDTLGELRKEFPGVVSLSKADIGVQLAFPPATGPDDEANPGQPPQGPGGPPGPGGGATPPPSPAPMPSGSTADGPAALPATPKPPAPAKPAATFSADQMGRFGDYFEPDKWGRYSGELHHHFGADVAKFASATGLRMREVGRGADRRFAWVPKVPVTFAQMADKTFAADAEGHEHKGKGPGGGQFAPKGGGDPTRGGGHPVSDPNQPGGRAARLVEDAARVTWDAPVPADFSAGTTGHQFTTTSGQTYLVTNTPVREAGAGKVADGAYVSFFDASGSTDVTGAGDAHEVFSKASAAVLSLLKSGGHDYVTFDAKEPSRQKLYDRLAKTAAAMTPGHSAIAVRGVNGVRQYYVFKDGSRGAIEAGQKGLVTFADGGGIERLAPATPAEIAAWSEGGGKTFSDTPEPPQGIPGAPELAAAMMDAYADGDDALADALAELADDPEGLAELVGDIEGGHHGTPGKRAFAAMIRTFAAGVREFSWSPDPTPRSKTRVTNTESGLHAYGVRAQQLLAAQGRADRGEPEPPHPARERAKQLKEGREPAREKARAAWKKVTTAPHTMTADDLGTLREHLNSLTRDEVRAEVKRIRGGGHGGKLKAELVDALKDHARETMAEAARSRTQPLPDDPARLALAGLQPNRYKVTTEEGEEVPSGKGYQRWENGVMAGYTPAQAAKVAAGVTAEEGSARIAEHERAAADPRNDEFERERHGELAAGLREHHAAVFGGKKPDSEAAPAATGVTADEPAAGRRVEMPAAEPEEATPEPVATASPGPDDAALAGLLTSADPAKRLAEVNAHLDRHGSDVANGGLGLPMAKEMAMTRERKRLKAAAAAMHPGTGETADEGRQAGEGKPQQSHTIALPKDKKRLTIDQAHDALAQMGYKQGAGVTKKVGNALVTLYHLTNPDGTTALVTPDEIKQLAYDGAAVPPGLGGKGPPPPPKAPAGSSPAPDRHAEEQHAYEQIARDKAAQQAVDDAEPAGGVDDRGVRYDAARDHLERMQAWAGDKPELLAAQGAVERATARLYGITGRHFSAGDDTAWMADAEAAFADGQPPGPPPRPNLKWKAETHRWVNPETGEEHHRDGTPVGKNAPAPTGADSPPPPDATRAAVTSAVPAGTPPGVVANLGDKAVTAAAKIHLALTRLTPAMHATLNAMGAVFDTSEDFKKFGYAPGSSGAAAGDAAGAGDPLKASLGVSTHVAAAIAAKVIGAGLVWVKDKTGVKLYAEEADDLAGAMHDAFVAVAGEFGLSEPPGVEEIAAAIRAGQAE